MDDTVHIFESIIDSLFVNNSIAMLGSSLSPTLEAKLKNRVYCLDNDQSNDTLKKMNRLVDNGEHILIWPDDVGEGDVGEMVENGWSPNDIMSVINKNAFSGFKAKVKIGMLKTKKKRI